MLTDSMVCKPCQRLLRLRLHQKLSLFQRSRRSFHATGSSLAHSSLSLYWAQRPPSQRQLAAADWFFESYRPSRLWTAEEWRKQNQVGSEPIVPEVAFLGRSNVGKSSLLNALLNTPGLNPVGPKPGKTTVMTAWGLSATTASGGALRGFNGDTSTLLTVLDVPGYGYKSQETWGKEITKYLSRRHHLHKVLVLVDSEHGLSVKDQDILRLLRDEAIPHQLIASKADALLEDNGSQKPYFQAHLLDIASKSESATPDELLVTGARSKKDHELSMDGISAVRWSVLRAVGLEMTVYKMFTDRKLGKLLDEEQPSFNSANPHKTTRSTKPSSGRPERLPLEGRTLDSVSSPPKYESTSETESPLPASHPRAPPLPSPASGLVTDPNASTKLYQPPFQTKTPLPTPELSNYTRSSQHLFTSSANTPNGLPASSLQSSDPSAIPNYSRTQSQSRPMTRLEELLARTHAELLGNSRQPSPSATVLDDLDRSPSSSRIRYPSVNRPSSFASSSTSVPHGLDAVVVSTNASRTDRRRGTAAPAQYPPRNSRLPNLNIPPQSPFSSSGVGVPRGIEALLSATQNQPPPAGRQRRGTAAPPSATTPSQCAPPPFSGQGVSRGLDALLSATRHQPQYPASLSTGQRRRARAHNAKEARAEAPPARSAAPPAVTAIAAGPGVTRGMDALLAATQPGPKRKKVFLTSGTGTAGAGRKKRRRNW